MNQRWESLKIFVRLQWIDRVNTSAFLIGLSIQTAVLCLSIWDKSDSAQSAFVLAVRASFLTVVGITLMAAMSSLANDIRFGTFSYLMLSREHVFVIVFKRCFANTIVSFTTVLFPFAMAMFKFPELLSPWVFMVLALIFVSVTCAGFHIALIVNAFSHPARGVPWLRYMYLIVGLSLLPVSSLEVASHAFPFYWILNLYGQSGSEFLLTSLVVLGLNALWTIIAWLLFARRTLKAVESIQSRSKLRVA